MLTSVIVSVLVAAPPALETDTLRIDPEIDVREWSVPWDDARSRDPYVAPDGRVWFVGQRMDYVGVLTPETGEFERIDLSEGAGPHTVIVSPAGVPWFNGNRDRHIGYIDPESHQITRIDVPDDRVRDPHTMAFDSEGRIWFTAQGGGHIGRFDPRTEEWEVLALSGEGYRPYGIVVDGNDRPWFVTMGTNRLGTVDPETMEVREIVLPREETRSRRLDVTSDGRVWYADWAAGHIGVYDPATDEIREWETPGTAGLRPYALNTDTHDRIWFVETGESPNRLFGFDPATEEFFAEVEIPSGAGTVRHMNLNRGTNELWFGTDLGTVGRAVLP